MSVYEFRRQYKPFLSAIWESLRVGLVAFGLFLVPVGLKTEQDINSRLFLEPRWKLLFICVFLLMFVRFFYLVFIMPARGKYNNKKKELQNTLKKKESTRSIDISKFLIAIAFLFPVFAIFISGLQGSLKWVDNFGVQILLYLMLAWGLNIVTGVAGLLNLGYVGFYAVGAYSYALLSTQLGWSFWLAFPISGFLGALLGIILGFPLLRLRGDYLAIVTLAFGEVIRMTLINWREVTNGAAGISGIPKASFFGLFSFTPESHVNNGLLSGFVLEGAHYKLFLYYLILFLCLATAWITICLRRMPVGRAWEALREDEIACRSLGINTTTTKLTAFAVGSMLAGFAGSFFAARQGFVSPESFVFMESAIILAIVVLGGMGSLTGIAIAALVMIGGTEILRELGFLKIIFGPDFTPELFRMIVFGSAMVLMMTWKPRGFVGSRDPTILLPKTKKERGQLHKEVIENE